MSVHSNHYDNEEEYRRDLAWEYRREQADLYHYDDTLPDERICSNCQHCKEISLFKRKGRYVAPEYVDVPDGIVAIYSDKQNRETTYICMNECSSDYLCEIEEDHDCKDYEGF